MVVYVGNSFSLNMLEEFPRAKIRVRRMNIRQVQRFIGMHKDEVVSVIGHEDTARIVSKMLGYELKYNRQGIKLTDDDRLIVAQYIGPRLEEGATELPEGAEIRFFKVWIRYGE